MSLSTVLAKALFDNVAESPEELAFRKGDILMVLEQEGGGPGWWVCSLHGRQGIAPANRLRLLNTATTPSPAPSAEPTSSVYLSPSSCPAPNADSVPSVYLSPRPSAEESVYLSPPSLGGAGRGDGLPRARSSSASRPRPDWDVGVTGRARSPSLKGRGSDAGVPKPQTVYQTPNPPVPRAGPGSEAVYLAPSGLPRPVPGDTGTHLGPREALGAGHPEGCYLVPRVSAMPSEDVYQTPTGGVAAVGPSHTPATGCPASELSCPTTRKNHTQLPLTNGVPHRKEGAGLYQTPSQRGGVPRTPQSDHKPPAEPASPSLRHTPSSGSQPKGVPAVPPNARAKLAQASVRGSPLLPRTGLGRVQGSPNFARKPPPPAPPVRGVTKKDTPTSTPSPAGPRGGAREGEGPQGSEVSKEERQKDRRVEEEKKKKTKKKVEEEGEYEEPDDENINNQVYDTPPTSRWQHTASPTICVDDSIYNTPRAHPANTDQGLEVYDVPTLPLTMTSDLQQQTYSIPACLAVGAEVEEDVYSVPSLPGDLSASPGLGEEPGELYSVPGPTPRGPPGSCDVQVLPQEPQEGAEPDGGIYDMPAPPTSARRSSVSSTSSGDVQWRCSLSGLIQSALSSISLTAPPPRELAASLTEILSVWKAGQEGDAPAPPLLQAWSRLSDLLPALVACGPAPPSEALLSLVRRALEDSASLLQIQATPSRPRLPSQDSLSRRPLPALPVAEVKPLNVGMGGRKGSWIQERPLPPPPPPSFPLPPPTLVPTSGQGDEEELGNEYAGIGLTTAPPPFNGGDSVGYVKLQGKPDPSMATTTENDSPPTDPPTAEQRASPSPPLPLSLSLEDSELLSFYSSQSLSHLSCLADSIDALFTSVQGNQPPRVFVSRGKSLIVTAHKLVFIGDTLSRLLTSPDLRAKVTTAGGRLCQALKAVVVATKGAAQNYPSVPATQEMVDRVAELSQHAAGFSGLLQRLAEIS
ncbi:embryonal Fyn-associated substrate [Anguilla anguilla]|uniref:embryonal Fyn-associated substrate n=1 Tax=Anguilla anguilla TaxID=7936 RepID=UPI0015ADF623|nr:embryonal Fyn-associated substrate [Anguilla anguilla]